MPKPKYRYGIILWYDKKRGEGLLKGDHNEKYFFGKKDLISAVKTGDTVRYEISVNYTDPPCDVPPCAINIIVLREIANHDQLY